MQPNWCYESEEENEIQNYEVGVCHAHIEQRHHRLECTIQTQTAGTHKAEQYVIRNRSTRRDEQDELSRTTSNNKNGRKKKIFNYLIKHTHTQMFKDYQKLHSKFVVVVDLLLSVRLNILKADCRFGLIRFFESSTTE